MSQENLEDVRGAVEALSSGDLAAAVQDARLCRDKDEALYAAGLTQ
jgi:hypothetical protein